MDDYGLLEAIRLSKLTQVRLIFQKRTRDKESGRDLILSTLQRTNGGNKDVPFLLSSTAEDPAIIEYFVNEYDLDVNEPVEIDASYRETTFVIMSAIRAENVAVVEWILKNGGRTDVVDGRGWNALHHAVATTNYTVAKVVLSHSRSHVNVENSDGNTALHMATKLGHVEMVRMLVEEGSASLATCRSYDDMSPVHVAANHGHYHLLQLFCGHYGVNSKAQHKSRVEGGKSYVLRCPIHLAALQGNFSCVETLLKYCEPNTLDSAGNTPLHCCLMRNYEEASMKPFHAYEDCVKLLLNNDCDMAVLNSLGESVYDLAEKNGYHKMVEMLRNPRRSYSLKSSTKPRELSQELKVRPSSVVSSGSLKKEKSKRIKTTSSEAETETKPTKLTKKKGSKKEKSNGENNHVERKDSRKTSFKNKLKKFENIGSEEKAEEPDVTAWLQEQATLLKSKNEDEKTIPMAQSTPPPTKKSESFNKFSRENSETQNEIQSPTKKIRPPPPPKPVNKPRIMRGVPHKSSESQETESSDDQNLISSDQPKPVPRPRIRTSMENELTPTKPIVKKVQNNENESTKATVKKLNPNNLELFKPPVKKVQSNDVEATRSKTPKKFNKAMGVAVFPIAYKEEEEEKEKNEDEEDEIGDTTVSKSPSPKPLKTTNQTQKLPMRVNRNKNRQNDDSDGDDDKFKDARKKVKVLPDLKSELRNNKRPMKPIQKVKKIPEQERQYDDEDDEEDDEDEESEDSEDQRAMTKVLKRLKGDQHGEEEDEDDEEEEEEEEGYESSEEEEEEEMEDDVMMANPSPVFKPQRTRSIEVLRNSDKKLGFSIVGGNHDGIFVHSVHKHSSSSLKAGEQIMEVNGRGMTGKTKEEVYKLFETLTLNSEKVALVLTDERMGMYQDIVKNGGAGGDRFYVKAKFTNDTGKKKDLTVREGDVFCVLDSFPDKYDGFWRAQKMTTTFRKSDDLNVGLIPNRQKADQLALKQHLSSASGSRNGTFMRSFRRAKSAEKLSQKGKLNESTDNFNTSLTIIGYERVSQAAPSKRKRPVIVLGLFCDVVIDNLVNNSNLFFRPPSSINLENSNADFDDAPIDLEVLQGLMNDPENYEKRHLLTIMNPATIDFLRKKTYIDPIVVFISPVSKNIVKSVKNQLAPQFNKSVSHLFEEASKFEKGYSHLFSSIVSYTPDEWWFFHLKEAITYCQQQGLWLPEDVAFVTQKRAITLSTSGPKNTSPKKMLSRTMENIQYIQHKDSNEKKALPRGANGLPPRSNIQPQNSLPLPPRRSEIPSVVPVKRAVLPPSSIKHSVNPHKAEIDDDDDDDDEDDDDDDEESEDEESEEEEEPPKEFPRIKSVRAVKHGAVNGRKQRLASDSTSNRDQHSESNDAPRHSNNDHPQHTNNFRKAFTKAGKMNSSQAADGSSDNHHNKLVFKKSSNLPSRETPL